MENCWILTNGKIEQWVVKTFNSNNQGRVDFPINFISTSYFASPFVKSTRNVNSTFSLIYVTRNENYIEGYLFYANPTGSGWANDTATIYINGY